MSTKTETSSNLMEVSAQLRALGDPVRLQMVDAIAASPEREVCAQDLASTVNRSQPTASHHLRILKEAGIIEGDRRGTWIYYRLVGDSLEKVRRSIDGTASALTT